MKQHNNFVEFGTHDDNTIQQMEALTENTVRAALLADGHYGYIAPVGSVIALDNAVSVPSVGYDIGCGNAAIRTNLHLSDLHDLSGLADEIASDISFGVGGSASKDANIRDHTLFSSDAWQAIPDSHREQLRDKARNQLTSVGSGNHYVDVFVDENDAIWVGVHFGSRGLGHTIASAFLAIGTGGNWGDRAKEQQVILNLDTQAGQEYWALMNLAGEYAYAGREWVARKVMELLGGKEVELIHNHHNFAWKEKHLVPTGPDTAHEPELIVIRKGATPAFPRQKGFVGGSMGDNAVILEGRSPFHNPEEFGYDGGELSIFTSHKMNVHCDQINALFSTVHGAGRVMSRTQAAGKFDRKKKIYKTRGLVSPDMMKEWLGKSGTILRGGGLDESPHAYRRLPDVLKAQGDTITVLHTLKPLIVVMAGNDVIDPFKD